jgi:hypothetical protein
MENHGKASKLFPFKNFEKASSKQKRKSSENF